MSHSTLNTLEFVGALSARLAHALGNHLSVVTGNLCVATALPDDPQKVAAALHSALKGANEAGLLISRFVELRRSISLEAGATRFFDALQVLSEWVAARPGWSLDLPADLAAAEDTQLRMPADWLRFALEALATETKAPSGAITLSLLPGKAPADLSLHLVFALPCAKAIDWNSIRRDLANFKLTAAFELIGQAGGKIESSIADSGLHQIRLQLPLAAPAA
jgi:hypothetical protein